MCLFDKFQERNATTKIEALRSNGNITESNGKFSSEIEEQLHLKFDNDKKVSNIMQPTTHIYLFRSIINYRLKEKHLRDFEKRLEFPVNALGAKFIKRSNILKQFVGKLPTNCFSVFDDFVGRTVKELNVTIWEVCFT